MFRDPRATLPEMPSCATAMRVLAVPFLGIALSTTSLAAGLPGGVADEATDTGFVVAEGGGVEALKLKTGQVIWKSPSSGQPLAVYMNLVLILVGAKPPRHGMQVIGLETSSGSPTFESDLLLLPSWAGVALEPGRGFSAQAYLEGATLVIYWSASTHFRGGVPGPPGNFATGWSHVDLSTGKSTAEPGSMNRFSSGSLFSDSEISGRRYRVRIEDVPRSRRVAPRFLEAVDPSSGKILWQHRILDSSIDLPVQ